MAIPIDPASTETVLSYGGSPPSETSGVLRFPIENQEDYKARIEFTVVQVDPMTIYSIRNLDTIFRQTQEEFLSSSEKTGETIPEGSDLRDGVNNQATANNSLKTGSADNQSVDNAQKQKKYGGKVILHMPQSIQIRDAVQYDTPELGAIGGAIDAAARKGDPLVSAAIGAIGDGINSFIDTFTTTAFDTPLARLALSRTAEKFGSSVGGAVKLNTRVIVNPNTRALFKNVTLREMPFTFRMVATTADEAESIKNIIKFFRTELYPEGIKPVEGSSSEYMIGYKLPNLFEIRMYYENKLIATQFLDSYLRDVSVSYNPGQASFHKDGNFTEVEMTLSFIESRTLLKKDVAGNGIY